MNDVFRIPPDICQLLAHGSRANLTKPVFEIIESTRLASGSCADNAAGQRLSRFTIFLRQDETEAVLNLSLDNRKRPIDQLALLVRERLEEMEALPKDEPRPGHD